MLFVGEKKIKNLRAVIGGLWCHLPPIYAICKSSCQIKIHLTYLVSLENFLCQRVSKLEGLGLSQFNLFAKGRSERRWESLYNLSFHRNALMERDASDVVFSVATTFRLSENE